MFAAWFLLSWLVLPGKSLQRVFADGKPKESTTEVTNISLNPPIQIRNTSTPPLSSPSPFAYRFEGSDLQVDFYQFGKKVDYSYASHLFNDFAESTSHFDLGKRTQRVPGGRWEEYYGTMRLRIDENTPITRSKPGLTFGALYDASLVFLTVFPWHKTPSEAKGDYYATWFSLEIVDDNAGTVQGIANGFIDQRGPAT